MKKNISKKEFINIAFILIGTLLVALGVVGFLIPNKIATGGTSGLAIVLFHLLKLPMGVLLFAINLPLLIVGLKYLGKRFALKTVFAILLMSVFIDLLNEHFHLQALSNNLLLSTIYGGLIIGLGIGFIFKGEASAGGGTIIAKIVCGRTDLKPGTVILIIDIFVVSLSAIVFKNLELALWSMISIYVSSKFIDLVISGRRQNKIVHIASKNLTELNQIITEEIGVTGTIIKGNNLRFKEERNVLLISVSKNRIISLKNLVSDYDSSARMVVFEATELLTGN